MKKSSSADVYLWSQNIWGSVWRVTSSKPAWLNKEFQINKSYKMKFCFITNKKKMIEA